MGELKKNIELDTQLTKDVDKKQRRGIAKHFQGESQDDHTWFDIFGFGRKNILNNNLSYGLRLALPQCSCKRVEARPLKFKIEVPPNKTQKPLPTHIKGERCSRFNQWWNKCCQSAILKQSGIYWNLIQLFELKYNINGKETSVCDLVLGDKTTLAITLDIKRTYPSLKFFTSYGRRMLRRILLAYAFFDPEVGYVQGLNFIVANLLWHSNEEQAFWALISLMYLYDMRCMFLPGLPGVFKRCEILEHLISKGIPKLHAHLKSIGVHIPMISSDWLMTLCANSIPIKPLGRLWDSFFSEGWLTIFRFIVYRLHQFQEYLITMTDIADIMKVIKYGTTNMRWSFTELIPGFGSSLDSKRHQLITEAYSINVDNLTNDPNKNCNELDWLHIVEESLKFNIDPQYVQELELTNSEILYHDCRTTSSDSSILSIERYTNRSQTENYSDNDYQTQNDAPLSHADSNHFTKVPENATVSSGTISEDIGEVKGKTSTEEENIGGGGDTPPLLPECPALPLHLLKESGYGEVAVRLTSLVDEFKCRLDAIGVSNAYSLHLRALNDV